ncbi:protein of unknown function DUF87 [Cellulomonas flavigena DSM 20109]|uniref:AAA+ ATPase domain-containing protein n=1 Tax=Cellulomonas flavigena (strain ATCC 482 / DSM 20109 / BCRC 11376 / JCM 18109 / NBRC 3775 / NCIMB 8073 / NRS 134) TaxID=446466 RepID=D5UJX2_CELFN|nr:DUF87 domain-containing protein [Cellulomonas flavigena]ADG73714.1 protein of unknown function DUF87 [Cellulomonas flavigena DSM 20109]
MPRSTDRPSERPAWIRRVRVFQALAATAILLVAASNVSSEPLAQWWFWVAATTALTLALVEPYYTGVQAAMLFGAAGLAAGLTADRAGVEPLWIGHVVLAGAVFVAALTALASQPGRLRDGSRWVATRFGRPLWLGLSAVTIEALRQAASGAPTIAMTLAGGTLAAVLVAAPDWYRLVGVAQPAPDGIAIFETAVEPNLMLLATDRRYTPGAYVEVHGVTASRGVVVGNLAHKGGNRIQVALEEPWHEVADSSGQQCEVVTLSHPPARAVAFVSEGSTDRVLSLRPFGGLVRGDTVYWEEATSGARYLYQVVARELAREMWDASSVVTERATAVLLGAAGPGGLTPGTALPAPYVPVLSADEVTGPLAPGFERIGTIAGTALPFGVSVAQLRGHHLAILGMSGMGKSTVARRLIDLMSSASVVVSLDGTGEYRARFGLPAWNDAVGLTTPGAWVYEPAGVPALRVSEFIKMAMTQAAAEYAVGDPLRRTVLLEEAHSYLPEWNFVADRNESSYVAQSCRYILQARKFGLSFILVSQRTAVISKSALSQCESYIALRTLDATSLEYLEGVLGSQFRETVSGLQRYQAVCAGPAFSTSTPVVVNLDPYPAPPPAGPPTSTGAPTTASHTGV